MSNSTKPNILASVHESWLPALRPLYSQIETISKNLSLNPANQANFIPRYEQIFQAYAYPFENVKVLILGQDPYPTAGHAMGLSFSLNPTIYPLAKSLQNIYRELYNDLGILPPSHGDLRSWCQQGVMLLNRVLTVAPKKPNSHKGQGWEAITAYTIQALVQRQTPIVAILWGKNAQSIAPLLGKYPTICSAHPSPLSAHQGFFGSKPFSRANNLLAQQNCAPIDWRIEL